MNEKERNKETRKKFDEVHMYVNSGYEVHFHDNVPQQEFLFALIKRKRNEKVKSQLIKIPWEDVSFLFKDLPQDILNDVHLEEIQDEQQKLNALVSKKMLLLTTLLSKHKEGTNESKKS